MIDIQIKLRPFDIWLHITVFPHIIFKYIIYRNGIYEIIRAFNVCAHIRYLHVYVYTYVYEIHIYK